MWVPVSVWPSERLRKALSLCWRQGHDWLEKILQDLDLYLNCYSDSRWLEWTKARGENDVALQKAWVEKVNKQLDDVQYWRWREVLSWIYYDRALFFFFKKGVGLLVVYRWSISACYLGLQLGASCVNQALICFSHPFSSPIFFLLVSSGSPP